MTALIPSIKSQWVAALRSGDYKQGRYALYNPGDRYCCLGVLCDLHRKATQGTEPANQWLGKPDDSMTYLESLSLLPEAVIEWANLWSCDPSVKFGEDGHRKTLAGLNDSGLSFETIADIIEEQF